MDFLERANRMSARLIKRPYNSQRLVGKLAAYSAATVGLMSTEAYAAVVYSDLRSANLVVNNGAFDIDLDQDGRMDLQFIHSSMSFPNYRRFLAKAKGLQSTVVVPDREGNVAANLSAGDVIRYQDARLRDAVLNYYIYDFPSTSSQDPRFGASGEFGYGQGRGYLGVRFSIAGSGSHAGWIDIENLPDFDGFRIYGFAYESVVRTSIIAGAIPEPPSLVLLAAGAAGLAALRAKRADHAPS